MHIDENKHHYKRTYIVFADLIANILLRSDSVCQPNRRSDIDALNFELHGHSISVRRQNLLLRLEATNSPCILAHVAI